ncbi:potassium-transporting ATPase, A subunit [Chthoniobacter flavus Ellin428]|uniref:Potassium-transporting ATPase potassium-binding subunit n=1 Tax=Chthoniobacter flavus Ellin428 TaxID=497964 RepID=B4CY74_9BACT|nr:potassium-transporting ATPase subunit KdpA [Chthoniobacter flavus]EDY21222.1 potassium-transporting ATPase, A subunit [Chthoniobacter flavus Ellin428]TCO87591.1 K+-transporting ATPase ATPase A chain [Chthoniobacter flavus]
MNSSDWFQLLIYVVALVAITKPFGLYLCKVLDTNGKTFLDPVFKPLEKLTYAVLRVDPRKEHDWKQYTIAMLMFSMIGMLFTYVILRLQAILPLNPQHQVAVSEHLAFNTAASFTTNTNWQSYGGETTMSYLSQMVALAFHNFASAAVGIAIAAVVVRGIARHSTKMLGNFWVDFTRISYYLLLPICIVYAVVLVSQGMIQNFKPYDAASIVEPFTTQVPKVDAKNNPVVDAQGHPVLVNQKVDTQNIAQGPMASQIAIKMLGTNGGGFTNANAAQPFENPTPLSNFLQMLSIFAIGSGLTYYYGRQVKHQGHGWAVWAAMITLFLAGVLVCWHYEAAGNSTLTALGVDPADGNMEGKEVRFGVFNSALFATITTDASCGAVNAMHDSFTPLGGLIPLFNMHLGEIVIGGVGAGLYGMIVFVILAVFIAGLMVGRTPEFLGKKIEPYDVKMASIVILVLAWSILGFSGWACLNKWGAPDPVTHQMTDGTNNNGPHGFTEILYAYSSATANNGSAFAGIGANTAWYNVTLAFAMLVGRFAMIVPIMALAGSLARKKLVPESAGTFPVSGPLFTVLLMGTILIVGALNFFPALTLGPIVEHFLMHVGKLY